MTQNERPPRFFPLMLGLGAGLLILLIGFFIFTKTRPIQWYEAQQRYRLWRAGARPLLWEKHRGFQLDRCAGAASEECRCIWLIHGMADSVSTWRRFFLDAKAFGETPVRIFAVDLPGHGGSLRRKNIEEYRVPNMAAEFDAGIAATPACERNILVGNSFGGWVAAEMAVDHPEHYERLFLLSPAGVKKADEETKDLFASPTVESLKEFQKRAYYHPRELPPEAWKKAAESAGSSAVGDIRKVQTDADRLDGKLSKIRTPTTLIWGEADRILPKSVMDVFIAGIPGLKFVELPKCGHLPQKECPEALFQAIGASL